MDAISLTFIVGIVGIVVWTRLLGGATDRARKRVASATPDDRRVALRGFAFRQGLILSAILCIPQAVMFISLAAGHARWAQIVPFLAPVMLPLFAGLAFGVSWAITSRVAKEFG